MMKIKIIFTTLITIFILSYYNVKSDDSLSIKWIPYFYVVDEAIFPWKYGLNNLYDNDNKTCVAFYGEFIKSEMRTIQLSFNKMITIDKIVINNGYARTNWLYYANSRLKSITINLSRRGEGSIESKTIILKDINKNQTVKFNEGFDVTGVSFRINSIYSGKKYSDICISGISFFFKNKKYNISKESRSRKNYLLNLEKFKKELLINKNFNVEYCRDRYFILKPSGKINFYGSYDRYCAKYGPIHSVIKNSTRWKMKDAVLYFYCYKRWRKVDYRISLDGHLKILKVGNYKLKNQNFQ